MVKVEGKTTKHFIPILIDPRSTHTYVTPKNVGVCLLKKKKHNKSSLVQLDMGRKRKVSEVVEEFPIELNKLFNTVDFNVLPLGSYDDIIGMDWVERHSLSKVQCYNKVLECIDGE